MKIVLTTTLVAILALGLFGINNNGSNSNNIDNAFAQGDGMMGNDTGMMGNDTGMMNATLAYAQEGGMMEMDEDMMMTMSSNQSKGEMNLNGTIEVESTIAEAFKSKVTTDMIGAIEAAQASVGANSVVKEAELTHAHGYLLYKIMAVDENHKKYKVIVDPGNGQVLMKKEVTWYDEHKMKYDDKKEKMKMMKMKMMKDKEY